MAKKSHPAAVNMSFTMFYLLSAIGFSFLFINRISQLSNVAWFVVLGYALLSYFVWDFMRQLYSPGQAVFLYCITFWVMPFILKFYVSYILGITGFVIFVSSYIVASLVELAYESLIKKRLPLNLKNFLMHFDANIDKGLIKISDTQLVLSESRGIIFATILILIYLIGSYSLLRI